jgi:hypothetical protein
VYTVLTELRGWLNCLLMMLCYTGNPENWLSSQQVARVVSTFEDALQQCWAMNGRIRGALKR